MASMGKEQLLKYRDYLISGLQSQLVKTGMAGFVVGLSGGVDSSVVAALAMAAAPTTTLGVLLPIGEMGVDKTDALALADTLKIKTVTIELGAAYDALVAALEVKSKIALANIKPRLRMSALYALAQEKRLLVLGTDNAAEGALGYFTKHGDGGVDLLPIVHLLKTDVKALAIAYNLPANIGKKPPTAALGPGQTDEGELGFKYDQVDRWLLGDEIDYTISAKIMRQVAATRHKREPLPMPDSPYKGVRKII